MVVQAGRAEKLPPHDTDAEEAVIASILVDPGAMDRVAPKLRPEDFFREKNAWIYEACRELWDGRHPIDQLTVAHELNRRGRLEDVGGIAYLSRLITELPTPVGVEHYASIVQSDATYRRLISAAGQIARMAHEGGADVDQLAGILGEAERLIAEVRSDGTLRDFVHIRDLLAGYLESAQAGTGAIAPSLTGITTGFMDLDTALGGMKRGDLIVVAARPGLGKTSLVLNFAKNAASRQTARTAFFSVEMAAEQLVQRLVAMESGVDSTRLAFGNHTDRDERLISHALGVLAEMPIYFDDSAGLTVAEMRAKARRLQLEHGLDLIVVDYLQLMHSGIRSENRVQEVSYISRSLKQLARDLDVPVVACSQLSRAAEARANNVPQLSDLRESGSIEQDADVVMFIYRESAYLRREDWEKQHRDQPARRYPAEDAQIILAKHRNGPTGAFHVRFRQKISRFEDLLVQPEEFSEAPADTDEAWDEA